MFANHIAQGQITGRKSKQMQLCGMLIQSWREKVKDPPTAMQKSTYGGQESGVETVLHYKEGQDIKKNMAECQLINQTVWGSRVMTISASDGKIILTCVYHRHGQQEMLAWCKYFLLAFGLLYDTIFSVVSSNFWGSSLKIKFCLLSLNTNIIIKVDICHCNT